MPLQSTSGAATYDAFGGGAAVPNYIEDVFSTWLYAGNNSTQTITNGIDLSTKGGLVWLKSRSSALDNVLFDTARGTSFELRSNATNGNITQTNGVTAFNTTGFNLGNYFAVNGSSTTYASWTFREQPKFFDVVTWTGNDVARTIAHNLGSVPGCIMVKRLDTAADWRVYHRANTASPQNNYLVLNTTAATVDPGITPPWNDTQPTATVFSIGTESNVNASGGTYVAYLFAHDAGGFGLTGTDNVISCGSYTGTAGVTTVNVGFEPQWLLIKRTNGTADWKIVDNMRGFTVGPESVGIYSSVLVPNTSGAEAANSTLYITSTGFNVGNYSSEGGAGNTFVYIAIRRGPMKVPTTGTSVFAPVTYTGTNVDNRLVDTGILTDAIIARRRNDVVDTTMSNRLQADGLQFTNLPDDQKIYADGLDTAPDGLGNSFSVMNGFYVGNSASTNLNQASTPQLAYAFRRAPSFMDVVCYTGTGSARTVAHNLAAVPELMIVKSRSVSANWAVYAAVVGNTSYAILNSANEFTTGSTFWNNTTPTASVFTVGDNASTNSSGVTYVAYLAATVPGVSKVGSYTGTGSNVSVNCGFTSGARFVMIKVINNSFNEGQWYVWDSARGISSGNDPFILLNQSSAETTNTDYVNTASNGFVVNAGAPGGINESGGTYLFWAIA